jgi:hypothetical protein
MRVPNQNLGVSRTIAPSAIFSSVMPQALRAFRGFAGRKTGPPEPGPDKCYECHTECTDYDCGVGCVGTRCREVCQSVTCPPA